MSNRNSNATKAAEDVLDMFINAPIEDWDVIIHDMNVPYFKSTLMTILVTSTTIMFEDDSFTQGILTLLDDFFGWHDDIDFLKNHYQPKVPNFIPDTLLQFP